MPLYHVHVEHPSDAVATVPLPVAATHYEVEASDLQAAGRLVLDVREASLELPEGVRRRRMQDPYTYMAIKPDPKAYDGMGYVIQGRSDTLPHRVSIQATLDAIAAHCSSAGVVDEGDVEIGVHHLLHGLADQVAASGIDFDVIVQEAADKIGSGLRKQADEIAKHRLAYGAFEEDAWSAAGGKAAIERYAAATGRTEYDAEEVVQDILHGLSAVARREGFDLAVSFGQVAEDRARADLDRRASSTFRTAGMAVS